MEFNQIKVGVKLKIPKRTTIGKTIGFEHFAVDTQNWLSYWVGDLKFITISYIANDELWFPGVILYFEEVPMLRARFYIEDLELYIQQ